MRTAVVGFTAVLLAARAASAGSILFATAASTGGVDGFCLERDGSIAPAPKVQVATAGGLPRRLVVGNSTLYVAEVDRIEAFPIGGAGVLRRPTSTKVTPGLDPRDLALSPDGHTLYATQHAYITAYALGADGSLPDDFTSCQQGPAAANYLDLQVTNGLLYVSADDAPGRIEIYYLGADGGLPQVGCGPATKKDRPAAPIWPDSERTRIQKPKGFAVVGDMIYVEERALHRLIAFRLQPDGTFCDKKRNRTDKNDIFTEDCTGFDQLGTQACTRRQAKKQRQQCTASHTAEVLQYEGLALHPNGETLIGTQFFKGRIDAYRLRPDTRPGAPPPPLRTRLPKHPSVESAVDPVMTPVRLAVGGNAVYVAGGELDRVVAYRLTSTGVLADPEPFSRTDELKDSFPNDVAVAMLSAPCD